MPICYCLSETLEGRRNSTELICFDFQFQDKGSFVRELINIYMPEEVFPAVIVMEGDPRNRYPYLSRNLGRKETLANGLLSNMKDS